MLVSLITQKLNLGIPRILLFSRLIVIVMRYVLYQICRVRSFWVRALSFVTTCSAKMGAIVAVLGLSTTYTIILIVILIFRVDRMPPTGFVQSHTGHTKSYFLTGHTKSHTKSYFLDIFSKKSYFSYLSRC